MKYQNRSVAALDQELDGAGALVADRLRERHRRFAHLLAQRRAHARRRRLLDDLLVAPLQRAVALEEMHDVAVAVAEHLHLDVARLHHDLFDQHASIAERALGLALRRRQQLRQIGLRLDEAHAAPAAAGHRLDHHGVADLPRFRRQRFRILLVALVAGHDRHAGLDGDLFRGRLAAERPHRLRRRADEDEAGSFHRFGKIGVLRQEAIARMDGLGSRRLGGGDDLVASEIAFGRRRWTDVHGLVGVRHMQRLGVGIRIDGDGRDAETARGADDPASDLAPVGDQDLCQHGAFMDRPTGGWQSPLWQQRSGLTRPRS